MAKPITQAERDQLRKYVAENGGFREKDILARAKSMYITQDDGNYRVVRVMANKSDGEYFEFELESNRITG